MSSSELIFEAAGFVPVFGEIVGIVEFFSEEKKDYGNLLDVFVSAITEKDISKHSPLFEELDSIGKFFDLIGLIDIGETIVNWNSPDKLMTGIAISFQTESTSYLYEAYVDDELLFTEYWSGFSGTYIKKDDDFFEVEVS